MGEQGYSTTGYARKHTPGETTALDFIAMLSGFPGDTVILDGNDWDQPVLVTDHLSDQSGIPVNKPVLVISSKRSAERNNKTYIGEQQLQGA